MAPQQTPPPPNVSQQQQQQQSPATSSSAMPQDPATGSQPPHPISAPSISGPNQPTNQSQSPAVPPPIQNFPQGPTNQDFYNRPDQVRFKIYLNPFFDTNCVS